MNNSPRLFESRLVYHSKIKITAETLFEDDLGITGDDGVELLEATEKHFGVELCSEEDGYRKTFNLAPNEYLFHPEGFCFNPFNLIRKLLGLNETEIIRKLTVGELYDVVCRAIKASK